MEEEEKEPAHYVSRKVHSKVHLVIKKMNFIVFISSFNPFFQIQIQLLIASLVMPPPVRGRGLVHASSDTSRQSCRHWMTSDKRS